MFPNNSLKSISPDVRMMQTFPNIFFLKEMVVGSSQEKETLRCVGIIQSHLTFWGCIPPHCLTKNLSLSSSQNHLLGG